MFEEQAPRGLHATLNPWIEVDGDRARAESDWLFFRFESSDGGSWSLFAGGHYADALVRTPAGWRFARRADALRGNASMADLTS
jgi:hypothetical protein